MAANFATLIPKHMDHTQASLLDHREVAQYLESDLKFGLVGHEVQTRLKQFGLNKFETQPRAGATGVDTLRHTLERVGRQLLHPLAQLLLICGLAGLALNFYDISLAATFSLLTLAALTYLQEWRTARGLEELAVQVPSRCQVIRDRQLLELETELLVPGDIVHLREGQRVPADVRLFDVHSLRVDEANLTGKTRAQRKCAEPLAAPVSAELAKKSVRFFSDLGLASSTSLDSSGYSSSTTAADGHAHTRADSLSTTGDAGRTPTEEATTTSANSGAVGPSVSSEVENAAFVSTVSSAVSSSTVKQLRSSEVEMSLDRENKAEENGNQDLSTLQPVKRAETQLRLALVSRPHRSAASSLADLQVAGTCEMYQNLALMGTRVERGHSMGVVIATGKSARYATEVYQKLKKAHESKTPLQVRIDAFALNLTVVQCLLIGLASIVAIGRQQVAPQEVLHYAIALGCLSLPETLPVVAMLEQRGIEHKIHAFLTFQLAFTVAPLVLVTIGYATASEVPLTVAQLLYLKAVPLGPILEALAAADLGELELGLWPGGSACAANKPDKQSDCPATRSPLLNCHTFATVLLLTCTLTLLNGALYDYLLDTNGQLDGRARTLLISCLVFCAIFASMALKSKSKTVYETRLQGNNHLLACCTICGLVQVLLAQLEPLGRPLAMVPVSPLELLYVFAWASLVLVAMDSLKLFTRFLDYARRLLLKLAANLQVPTGRDGSYSTASASSAKSAARRFASDSDYLPASTTRADRVARPEAKAPARCLNVTRLTESSAPKLPAQCTVVAPLPTRTLFGNTFRRHRAA